jgi:F0F1-type ATP synthase delta subunit
MAQHVSRRRLARLVANELVNPKVKPGHLAKALAAYLLQHHMTDQLEMLITDIAAELAKDKRQVYATVRTAHELSASLQDEIAQFLRRAYDVKHVELNPVIDPELLGGVLVQTPDAQLNTSVRSKLQALRQA